MVSDNPNPMFSFLLFIILTIAYFIVKYIFLKKGNSTTYLLVALYSYLGVNIISQLIINITLTNQICGESQWYDAFFITAIPWVVIFGALTVLLQIFPGWLMPFSNTFGYGIAKIAGLNDLFQNILVEQGKSKSPGFNKALQEIYSDQSLLINKVSVDNFDKFWSEMTNANMLKSATTNIQKQEFRNFVYLKTLVSEFIWFLLVGLLTISASYNYIINIGCQQSVASMKARHEEHDNKVELIRKSESSAPEKRVFATFE
tara:strand:- start:5722 stop:6498 length:777 start_codon:yes stop_codon:yes gene_type:complete